MSDPRSRDLVTTIGDWGLYQRYGGKYDPDWIKLILIAPWEPSSSPKRPRKKTFWFAWNKTQQRLTRHEDTRVLRKRHEKIYFKLLQVCVREWPPER
jgi:hypothetical protein